MAALLLALLALASASDTQPPPIVLHVYPDAAPPAPSTELASTTTFPSVAAARDALRAMQPLPEGGATVLLHGGTHPPFALGAADSGRDGAPIVYAAAAGEPSVVSGGVGVPGSLFKPWTTPGVLKADLSHLVTAADLGGMHTDSSMGCVGDCQHDKAELFLGGESMTLSRYPNKGSDGGWRFLHADKAGKFGRVSSDPGGPWFLMRPGANASRIAGWAEKDPDAYLHG